MKHLIDKDTLVAEIERLIETNKAFKKTWKWKFKWFYRTIVGRIEVLEGLKIFLDTLEVKEANEALRTEYEKGRADAFAEISEKWEDSRRKKDIMSFLESLRPKED